MSWEEWTTRHTCPCGKGEYEVLHRENDWFQHDEYYKMLCSECNQLYKYVSGGLWHKGIEGDRGWTLKSVIEDEERMRQEEIKHKKEVSSHLKELYFDIWQLKFENCKTKKQIWKILTLNDKYSPSLSSYYYYHKGLSLEECLNSANSYFNYDNILRVLYVCEIDNPKWNSLGLNDDEIKSFNKQWCSLKEK